MLQRAHFTPIVPMPNRLEAIVALLTVAISAVSIWFGLEAMRTLGKQWSYQARLVEGHKLIVSGPYRFVRHPIYTAMFGKLLATALAVSHWIALGPVILLFAIGTMIRVRSEEKLLQAAFGVDFVAYQQHVPAVLPRLW